MMLGDRIFPRKGEVRYDSKSQGMVMVMETIIHIEDPFEVIQMNCLGSFPKKLERQTCYYVHLWEVGMVRAKYPVFK